jgi:uncharacterized protein (TIGR02118 family)
MKCVTVLYPYVEGKRFDYDHYKNVHAPLVEDVLGEALKKFEVRKGVSAADGSAPPYRLVVSIYYEDEALYQKKVGARQDELIADVAKFTEVMPVMQIDEVFYPA